ncbi:alpha-(1-2)-phosphatidylinositol mannosyltransferase [[Actinomadura] parvosata subsp. kistnae]|uniref:Alpha-(1-2)-phosphatidylinositol mannosyltransferase n=1 Tax=[Actinomadura] parvosata subsp. kistnae TaxID=1909395 RepID=A0A1V0A3Z2_9ACTN|nr:glycosyltransferase family 4 protein [Nonomuraea sp. ATCC 55076]AQZ64927.1 alpha-(1-2)-phosphatidylinositol mannosyltransferase [Nonomuraea sp. ATCC 55076]
MGQAERRARAVTSSTGSVLFVTNDFPPRPGGIQSFVHGLALRTPGAVVYAPAWPGAEEFDRRQPFPVVRHPTRLMLPTPAVARTAAGLVAEHGARAVVFGAAAPLGLLAPRLRRAGARRVVMLTHGHEASWAISPGFRAVLRRIGGHADVVTYLGEYTRRRLAAAVPAGKLVRLAPGVDVGQFHPGVAPAELGLGGRPVVVCVSRLVPRKGQDQLIRAWPHVLRSVPDAVLLLVGGGPYRRKLERMAAGQESIRFTGTVPAADLPGYYAAADVFAMPCRTRLKGVDVEGLGIVFLEASATGLPVVAGASGGAPDAVRPGETGLVVNGEDVGEVAQAVVELLTDPDKCRKMGAGGRDWVARAWAWEHVAARFQKLLQP